MVEYQFSQTSQKGVKMCHVDLKHKHVLTPKWLEALSVFQNLFLI